MTHYIRRFGFFAGMALIMLLALCMQQAMAQAAANVHFVSGHVSATAPGESARVLAKGDDLFSGDRVDTAENGRVQMRFTDGGLVSLMPNTTFSIDEYLHEAEADEDSSLVFGLLKGGLRTVTGSIGSVKHDEYELKTPVATLGIRGTEYIAVLRPANTLRVHVGRGKVVITNDQGSLEVPEGRNAVVTLGSAPEFSDQGPQYQATGPTGDRLFAGYQLRQDPHLLDPRVNMPAPGAHSFDNLPGSPASPGSSGPGSSAPLPPSGPGSSGPLPFGEYQLVAIFPPATGAQFYGPLELDLDFNADGSLIADPADFDTGTWQFYNIVTKGAMTWGELSDGLGFANDIQLSNTQYTPYVVGSIPTTIPTGMLNFSLDMDGANVARAYSSDGTSLDVGQLTRFDLGIDIGALEYTLDMQLNMNNMGIYSSNVSNGNLNSISSGSTFQFDSNAVTNTGGSGCLSSSCNLSVSGFLAGPDANQAGVVYDIQDGSDHIIGGASLTDGTPPSSPGI